MCARICSLPCAVGEVRQGPPASVCLCDAVTPLGKSGFYFPPLGGGGGSMKPDNFGGGGAGKGRIDRTINQ